MADSQLRTAVADVLTALADRVRFGPNAPQAAAPAVRATAETGPETKQGGVRTLCILPEEGLLLHAIEVCKYLDTAGDESFCVRTSGHPVAGQGRAREPALQRLQVSPRSVPLAHRPLPELAGEGHEERPPLRTGGDGEGTTQEEAMMKCPDVKAEVEHEPHWYVVRAGGITYAQGECAGYTHPTSPSAQCRGEGRGGAVSEGEGL